MSWSIYCIPAGYSSVEAWTSVGLSVYQYSYRRLCSQYIGSCIFICVGSWITLCLATAWQVVYGMDFIAEERTAQHRLLRASLLDHLSSVRRALVVIEEYDKADCDTRAMLRQLFNSLHTANITGTPWVPSFCTALCNICRRMSICLSS